MGKVVSVNVSTAKGIPKKPAAQIELAAGLGVLGDAHAAPGDRQVSLLMIEHINEARERIESGAGCGEGADGLVLGPGSFAENITTAGIDLVTLSPGDELVVGGARLRVTRIGKECHRPCAIYYRMGDCIMPGQGVFAEVLLGGLVRAGDDIDQG